MHNLDQLPMEHWVAGYLSEANLVGPDIELQTFLISSKAKIRAALTDWIDNYCTAHPLDKVYTRR